MKEDFSEACGEIDCSDFVFIVDFIQSPEGTGYTRQISMGHCSHLQVLRR
jgi:hypothetical protein